MLSDTIPGIRVVKAFAQERREAERFRVANQHNLQVNDRINKIWSLFSPSVSLLTEIGLLVVWGFGIYQVSKGQITVRYCLLRSVVVNINKCACLAAGRHCGNKETSGKRF